MSDPRVPWWATPRDLGEASRPPKVEDDDDGYLVQWGALRPVPINPDPDWYPPGGWPRQVGETTEAESQESGVETEGHVSAVDTSGHDSLDDFA